LTKDPNVSTHLIVSIVQLEQFSVFSTLREMMVPCTKEAALEALCEAVSARFRKLRCYNVEISHLDIKSLMSPYQVTSFKTSRMQPYNITRVDMMT
jgi:hypothetical protein